MPYHIPVQKKQLEALCTKWQVRELSFFGSVLRDDFSASSDVDVLVSFYPEASWTVWDLMTMKEELETLFGRTVDLVEKESLRNPWRKHAILTTHEVVYAA